ncbi:hypothetical protein MD484_g5680, partial [Candolleomyces efflorescens]
MKKSFQQWFKSVKFFKKFLSQRGENAITTIGLNLAVVLAAIAMTLSKDIVVPVKYIPYDEKSSIQATRLHIVRTSTFVLKQDPRRLFVFGMAVERHQLCLWYFSRSHLANSSSFNFVEDPVNLIRILISFMFADPISIGFDPSINRLPGSSQAPASYIYALDNKGPGSCRQRYFQTLIPLCGPPHTPVTGRATRVWEAQEVLAFDDPTPVEAAPSKVILREVWTGTSFRTESEIQSEIFADLDDFSRRLSNGLETEQFLDFEPDLKVHIRDLFVDEKYKEYFLTVIGELKGPVIKPPVPGYEEGADIFHISRSMYVPAYVGQKYSPETRQDIERRTLAQFTP